MPPSYLLTKLAKVILRSLSHVKQISNPVRGSELQSYSGYTFSFWREENYISQPKAFRGNILKPNEGTPDKAEEANENMAVSTKSTSTDEAEKATK